MTKGTAPPEPLLTIPGVADICRVSEKTIRRWINAGELPAIKLGAQWRVAPRDLSAFLRERRHG
jgi:excisionase family DNA binding protein